MQKILKKDIVIKAGTILYEAPTKTVRQGGCHFECCIGLSNDSHGFFTYCIDDQTLDEFFEEIEDQCK